MNGMLCRVEALRYSAWQSGAETEPDISFTGALFRRRLSLVSRMTIKVIHDLDPPDAPILFASCRGEVSRQFGINRMLIGEGELLPAVFSLSVFNAPPALASMALNLRAGYTAICPADRRFSAVIETAAAAVIARGGAADSAGAVILAYADEGLIPEYAPLSAESETPLAFAALLAVSGAGGVPLPFRESPRAFLEALQTEFAAAKTPS
ncbi:MAG: beta-ketoacyl synthase chain length factor [Treponema sp.]|jgi:hypothetical protein|nr:beta-ketoacyl synthase chain length factor [Treponema sp.]